MSGQIQNMNDHRTIGGDTSLATGQIILKTQTIHYIIENSLKTTIHLKFALFDSPEMGNLMIPVESPPFRGDQIPKKNDYKSWVLSRATFWNQLGNIHTHLKINMVRLKITHRKNHLNQNLLGSTDSTCEIFQGLCHNFCWWLTSAWWYKWPWTDLQRSGIQSLRMESPGHQELFFRSFEGYYR